MLLTAEALLTKPVLDLNLTDVNPQMTEITRVAPLPDGGALLSTMSAIPIRCGGLM